MSFDNPSIRVCVSRPPALEPHDAPQEGLADRRPAYTPPIDIHEGPDGLTLEADLPGATEHNLESSWKRTF